MNINFCQYFEAVKKAEEQAWNIINGVDRKCEYILRTLKRRRANKGRVNSSTVTQSIALNEEDLFRRERSQRAAAKLAAERTSAVTNLLLTTKLRRPSNGGDLHVKNLSSIKVNKKKETINTKNLSQTNNSDEKILPCFVKLNYKDCEEYENKKKIVSNDKSNILKDVRVSLSPLNSDLNPLQKSQNIKRSSLKTDLSPIEELDCPTDEEKNSNTFQSSRKLSNNTQQSSNVESESICCTSVTSGNCLPTHKDTCLENNDLPKRSKRNTRIKVKVQNLADCLLKDTNPVKTRTKAKKEALMNGCISDKGEVKPGTKSENCKLDSIISHEKDNSESANPEAFCTNGTEYPKSVNINAVEQEICSVEEEIDSSEIIHSMKTRNKGLKKKTEDSSNEVRNDSESDADKAIDNSSKKRSMILKYLGKNIFKKEKNTNIEQSLVEHQSVQISEGSSTNATNLQNSSEVEVKSAVSENEPEIHNSNEENDFTENVHSMTTRNRGIKRKSCEIDSDTVSSGNEPYQPRTRTKVLRRNVNSRKEETHINTELNSEVSETSSSEDLPKNCRSRTGKLEIQVTHEEENEISKVKTNGKRRNEEFVQKSDCLEGETTGATTRTKKRQQMKDKELALQKEEGVIISSVKQPIKLMRIDNGKENNTPYMKGVFYSKEKNPHSTPLANCNFFSPLQKTQFSASKHFTTTKNGPVSVKNEISIKKVPETTEKEENAKRKKEEIIKNISDNVRRKREQKIEKVTTLKQLAEKEKQEQLAKLAKEREEKEKKITAVKERQKEKILEKKREKILKNQVVEEKRIKEEQAKLLKLKEHEEEQKRLAEQRLKEEIAAEKLLQQRLAEELKLKDVKKAQDAAKAKTVVNQLKENKSKGEDSYDLTPQRNERIPLKPKSEDNYGISEEEADNSSDDEHHPKKEIPFWAGRGIREKAIQMQTYLHTDLLTTFMPWINKTPNVEELFQDFNPRYRVRTSSAHWPTSPSLPL